MLLHAVFISFSARVLKLQLSDSEAFLQSSMTVETVLCRLVNLRIGVMSNKKIPSTESVSTVDQDSSVLNGTYFTS